jgi:hypothetical protein
VFARLWQSPLFKCVVGINISDFLDLRERFLKHSPKESLKENQIGRTERLMLTLTWLRHGISQRFMAFLFECDQATISRILHDTIDQLYDLADEDIQVPEEDERENLSELFEGKQIVLVIDGAEQRVQSSDDKLLQNINFSGKKHLHTFTKLLAVDPIEGKVRFMSGSYPGSVNDLNLVQMPENSLKHALKQDEYILGDAGFKGMQHERIIAYTSKEMDGVVDKDFKRIRVIVENGIRSVRRWRICYNTFDGKHKGNIIELRNWHHRVWKVCAWLSNLYFVLRQ